MRKWEEFEIQCKNYFERQFGKYAEFTHYGGADSTIPDIKVKTNSGKSFFIEVKHSPAQCGQFVLSPDNDAKSFTYSVGNETNLNSYAQKIIDHMNKNFDIFSAAGTTGVNIIFDGCWEVFANWVRSTYKEKGVDFFVTNNYKVIPIEDFSRCFDITAKYRVKKSGTGDVGKKRFDAVLQYLSSAEISIAGYRTDKSKLFINSDEQLNKKRFVVDDTELMFSLKNDEYEIKKSSNTYNRNVIFSIKLKAGVSGMSDDCFINYLR